MSHIKTLVVTFDSKTDRAKKRYQQAFEKIIERPEEGCIRAKVKGVRIIFSCYAPPSATFAEYEQVQSALFLDARGHWPTIIAADFNAWALEWVSRTTDVRGRVLFEAFA